MEKCCTIFRFSQLWIKEERLIKKIDHFLWIHICNKDILLVPISGEIIDKVRQKKLAVVHRRYHCGHKKVGYKMNWKLMHEHGKVFSQTKREYRLHRDIFGLLSSSTGNICLLRIYANISAHWKKNNSLSRCY